MKKEDVIRMAQEAGLCDETGGVEGDGGCFYDYAEEIERFAAFVAAAEREACAKLCEQDQHSEYDGHAECAATIRKRGASVNP